MLRSGRRWLTAKASHVGRVVAPLLPMRAIDVGQWWLARAGPRLPVLARVVAENMRSAGVYNRAAFGEYFAQVARHLSNAMRIFRLARDNGAVGALARSQVEVDDSVAHIRRAMDGGRGAVIVPPHVCNYLLTLARLNEEVPVCVYLRWSDDERKLEIKKTWCEATGLQVILEPASAADPASRAAACVEALRGGACLVMTPDIAQRADKGAAVRLFGREVYLPTGPASIAMLAEAPLVPVYGRLEEHRHIITAREPIFVEPLTRAQGGRQAAIRQAMQAWADHFEAFIRACPQAWFLWADSRWTRVFRGDPRYATELGTLPAACGAGTPAATELGTLSAACGAGTPAATELGTLSAACGAGTPAATEHRRDAGATNSGTLGSCGTGVPPVSSPGPVPIEPDERREGATP